jgi:hypothetical protein
MTLSLLDQAKSLASARCDALSEQAREIAAKLTAANILWADLQKFTADEFERKHMEFPDAYPVT